MTSINDFAIEVATVNGSGSQTANNVLMRAIFQMGVPVIGKNYFPSNISGMPTWFQIRLSARGYSARKPGIDLMVCLNPETAAADLAKLPPGATCVFDQLLGLRREDVTLYPVPFQELVKASCPEMKFQRLVKNMVYVGVLARILGIELEETFRALARHLKGKAEAMNRTALEAGYQWAQANLPDQDRLRVERMATDPDLLMMDGNTACALGALFAGVSVVGWYPITPSTSIVDTLAEYAETHRVDPETGQSTVAILQVEDELASAGVVVGAGWAGARAMTATSGPGISLMSEFIGLAYYAEIPGVFFDVQRVGPSTGLPTRSSQSDIEICAKASHGDTLHINLYPATMEECFRFSYDAFDLAERFQTPVFLVSDLDLGMQSWITKPFSYPEGPLDRGKVLDEEGLKAVQDWGRYRDPDGDGIPWRTLPGTPGGKGAYFTRGSGHNERAGYTEKPEEFVQILDRLKRKVLGAARVLPGPVIHSQGAKRGIVAYGSSDSAVQEALDILRETHGITLDYLRVRAMPFSDQVGDFLHAMEHTFVVEQNRDGQMATLLRDAFPREACRLRNVLHYDSTPITAESIVNQILPQVL
nr:2-oxoacid:acceptor oxidoreductase subunit alpha [uncultured Holophaga sp.]